MVVGAVQRGVQGGGSGGGMSCLRDSSGQVVPVGRERRRTVRRADRGEEGVDVLVRVTPSGGVGRRPLSSVSLLPSVKFQWVLAYPSSGLTQAIVAAVPSASLHRRRGLSNACHCQLQHW